MAISTPVAGTAEVENNTIDEGSNVIVYNNPPTWSDDDLAVNYVVSDGDVTIDAWPSGFTFRAGQNGGGGGGRVDIDVATKTISSAAGEPATYSLTMSSPVGVNNGDARINMLRLQGADNSNPWAGNAGQSGNSATITIPAVTTTTDGEMVFAVLGYRFGGETPTDPGGGWTLLERSEGTTGSNKMYSIYYQTVATAGTVASTTSTLVSGGRWSSFVFRINPAPAATGQTLKVWDGSAWSDGIVKHWNGSSWVELSAGKVKHWNGSSWSAV